MISNYFSRNKKNLRYAWSFFNKRLIHSNLQILYKCNFKCQICDFWKDSENNSSLSCDQIRKISDELNKIGPQIISIGGGEPLLHKEIVEIVQTLAEYHFPVMICNGWFVTPELAKSLFDAGMYEISISVDYADPEKHDVQRGKKGAYDKAISALKILHENRTHSYQRVHMISVVMDDNIDEIEKLIKICKEIGITYLVSLYSDSRGIKMSRQIPSDVSEHLLGLKKKYKEFVSLRSYIGRFSESVKNSGVGPCYAGKNLCNIDSNGEVSQCIDCLDESVGNIFHDNIFELEKRLISKYRSGNCQSCWTSCRGSIESILYGDHFFRNLVDYYSMIKSVKL